MKEFVPITTRDRSLREIFCERFQCPVEEFESRLFWLCLPRWQHPLVRPLEAINRDYFTHDFGLLRRLARVTSAREVKYELESYRHYNPTKGWFRKKFKIRISGKRLLKYSSKWFTREASQQLRKLHSPSNTGFTPPSQ
jgi:hypothetical protein